MRMLGACALIVVLSSRTATAQPGSPVAGTVIDQAGGAVPEAQVTAVDADGVVAAKADTDTAGRFALPPLPAGRYVLHVQKPLFEPERVALDLTGSPIPALQITLRIAGLRELVTVEVPTIGIVRRGRR
jgi:hypothetical protein